jgi:hypothetical protein
MGNGIVSAAGSGDHVVRRIIVGKCEVPILGSR